MVHDHYKEMLPARALATLAANERAALNEHLLVCAECRWELETWEATAATLSLSATPMEPSPNVRERILQLVREERRSAPAEDADARVVPFRSQSRTMSYGLIAAGVICSILVGWIALMARQNRAARAEIARLNEQIQSTEARLTHQREILTMLTSRGTTITTLAGTSSMPGAEAMLAYEPKGGAMLIAKNLPAAPVGKAYQLWFIVDNKPLPGHTFNTDGSGDGAMQESVPLGITNKAVFAVTMENSGGASSPTGPLLLRSGL